VTNPLSGCFLLQVDLISTASLACLISGYAFADVFHPEEITIRGHIGSLGDDVCFNDDGNTNSLTCPSVVPNGGYFYAVAGSWYTEFSGINWCGVSAVNPVSSATCAFSDDEVLAVCTPDNYVLVTTSLASHYFAVKAGATCGTFNRPENEVIFPCLSTDAFDPVIGCFVATKPTAISVKDSYIKLDTIDAPPTTDADCDGDVSHEGRMVVDSANSKLYICTQAGWKSFSADTPTP